MYDIKDLTYKARLVCDGSRVDPHGLSTRTTVEKGISVRLLDLIADSQNLQVLCGDIGNVFIQDNTKENTTLVVVLVLGNISIPLLLLFELYMA